jgi:large subunit ribosomal protein L33
MAADTIKVIMRSTESRFFFTTTKNKRNKEKLHFKRYDPVVRKHVEFNEEKMK